MRCGRLDLVLSTAASLLLLVLVTFAPSASDTAGKSSSLRMSLVVEAASAGPESEPHAAAADGGRGGKKMRKKTTSKKSSKKSRQGSSKDDEDREDDSMAYLPLARCQACEGVTDRLISKAEKTPLGTLAKSMHNRNQETKIKRTKYARAHELVDGACVGSDQKALCQDVISTLEDELVEFALHKLDYDRFVRAKEEEGNSLEELRSALKLHGKDKVCTPLCSQRDAFAKQVKDAQKAAQDGARTKARRTKIGKRWAVFETLNPDLKNDYLNLAEDVAGVMAEYWILYCIWTLALTALGTYYLQLKKRSAEAILAEATAVATGGTTAPSVPTNESGEAVKPSTANVARDSRLFSAQEEKENG